MALMRAIHDKENPYVTLKKTCILDQRLSWKAKGIWMYAFSRPDDWQFYQADLIKQSTDGKESVTSGLRELKKAGYLVMLPKHNPETKRLEGHEWFFFETPKTEEEIQKMFPKHGKPVRRETRVTGNPPLLNKEDKLSKETTTTGAEPRLPAEAAPPPNEPPPKTTEPPTAGCCSSFEEKKELLTGFDLTDPQRAKLVKEFAKLPMPDFAQAIEAAKQYAEKNEVKNFMPMLRTALKEAWKPQVDEAEEKRQKELEKARLIQRNRECFFKLFELVPDKEKKHFRISELNVIYNHGTGGVNLMFPDDTFAVCAKYAFKKAGVPMGIVKQVLEMS